MIETPQAFDLNNLLLAQKRMSEVLWREYADTQLKYFTREYILQENITKYSYSLVREGADIKVVDPQSGEEIAQTFSRGVQYAANDHLRKRAWAEVRGFLKIAEQIKNYGQERFFVWISEPGLASDGFDIHSFTFIGQIKEREVEMVAYKNWVDKRANREFLGLDLSSSEVDLLESPLFLDGYNSYVDVIHVLDPHRLDDISEDDPWWFLDILQPFRRAIIDSLEIGDEVGAKRAKRAHDNYALAVFYGEDSRGKAVEYWAELPEVVLRGSCGFSGEGVVSSWFGIEDKYFKCPRCERKLPAGKGIVVCIYCGLYKGDYKPNDGKICA